MRCVRTWLGALCALLLLAGCLPGGRGAASGGSGPAGGVLTVVLDQDPRDLNHVLTGDVPSAAVAGRLFSGLVTINARGEPVADLAERWTASPDGRTWTFTLRQGLTWHDGQPLTADDYVFTVQALQDENLPSTLVEQWKGRQAERVDERTLRITLPEPFGGFLVQDATLPPLPRHILGGIRPSEWPRHPYNHAPVGNGPFKFVDWKGGQAVVLERNPAFHLGPPHLERIVFKIIPEQTAGVNALLAGEAQYAEVKADQVEMVQRRPEYRLLTFPDLGYYYIGFNMGRRKGREVPFFKDRRVRQAWAHAINKREVVAAAVGELGQPIEAPFAPVSWAYSPRIKGFAYDPRKAEKLLDEAGWRRGQGGVREKDGVRFAIQLPVRAGKEDRIRAAQVISAYLDKVGLKVEVTPEEFKSVMLRRLEAPGFDFDAIFMGWGLSADPDVYPLFHSSQVPRVNERSESVGGSNYFHYKNAAADRLIEAGRREVDQAKRKAIYQRLGEIIAEDQPYYFLWSDVTVIAVPRGLRGPEPSPFGVMWNLHTWRFER